ncbi:hypothetical protein [Thermoflavifilum thermophilum]|uniref:Uncharacterized protein n=1 Tax=Thermoflavifilum thermophilum TaxID=1393122 RepID=A0A1I7NC89_9BACT|nr:hypothetical protein [Thermoflavifilum thermophilum]SFV32294.1 hypothetical protein SAMN05660895_1297 [Thermoflavifilum thermophilum]
MRDVVNCIKKYVEITNDDKFKHHWKLLSHKLIAGVQNSYKKPENHIVKIIESIINSVGTFKTQGKSLKFSIKTNSIFIHGNKSYVEFSYDGNNTKRELGDIIFILSIVCNSKKYFEKMTINQVKKSKDVSWSFSSRSAKEQVYLLSRFPTFKGAKNSLIPSNEYSLPNYLGCLGSHGLLYFPGDFALISSKKLEVLLSKKSTISLYDLFKLEMETIQTIMCPFCLLFDYDIEECFYFFHKLIHYLPGYYRYSPFVCNLPILGNNCIAFNSYDFSNKYLLGHIGELVYAKNIPYNSSALRFLQVLLNAIKRKAENDRLENILNFIGSFYSNEYANSDDGSGREENEGFNYERGSIGIIHTIVDLEEFNK